MAKYVAWQMRIYHPLAKPAYWGDWFMCVQSPAAYQHALGDRVEFRPLVVGGPSRKGWFPKRLGLESWCDYVSRTGVGA